MSALATRRACSRISRAADQLNALAAVARKLREPEVLRKLRVASTPTDTSTPTELFEILTSSDMKSDRENENCT